MIDKARSMIVSIVNHRFEDELPSEVREAYLNGKAARAGLRMDPPVAKPTKSFPHGYCFYLRARTQEDRTDVEITGHHATFLPSDGLAMSPPPIVICCTMGTLARVVALDGNSPCPAVRFDADVVVF